MKVTLIDHTHDPEHIIARMSAICYGSKTDDESNERRVKHLMKVKHLATLRFAYATFKVEGISRACSHQLVRHPHLSYLQESQRYVNQKETEFVTPRNINADLMVYYDSIYRGLVDSYSRLIDLGVKKEDARYILPEGTHTSLYITGNFQAWYDFLRNRLDSHAQWEIKNVARDIAHDLFIVAPNVFKDFENERSK